MSIVTDNHSQMLCYGMNTKEFLLSPRDGPSAVGDKRRQKTVLWVPLVVALSIMCCAKDVTFKESESEWKSLMCSSVSLEDKPICVSRFLAALYKTTNVHTSSSEISSVICLRLTKGFKSVHNGDGMPPFSTVYSETTREDVWFEVMSMGVKALQNMGRFSVIDRCQCFG